MDSKKKYEETSFKIENLLNEIEDKGIFALAHMSEESQILITKWAHDIFKRYESVLENHPTKIKNIAELPASKQEIKMAIKILLTAPVKKRLDEKVDTLKDRFISIGAFQTIDPEDKEKIVERVNNIDQELESAYSSVFPRYHQYIEVIISEQNSLHDEVNNFIQDLKNLS